MTPRRVLAVLCGRPCPRGTRGACRSPAAGITDGRYRGAPTTVLAGTAAGSDL